MAKKVGNYTLGDVVGQGGFGVVFIAKRKGSKTPVAIKRIKQQIYADSYDYSAMEIELMREISHPNVVRLLDIQESGIYTYLVLDYCNGGDLTSYLEVHKILSEITISHFLHQLAAALQYLRAQGIIHRDLKPDNILVHYPDDVMNLPSTQTVVKIGDLGLSKRLRPGSVAFSVCGTRAYMAPEVVMENEEGYDGKADMWSLGTIVYLCLTRRMPFATTKKSLTDLKAYFVNNPELIPKIPDGTSEHLSDCVTRLLRSSPKDRMDILELNTHPFVLGHGPPIAIAREEEAGPPTKKLKITSREELLALARTNPVTFLETCKPHVKTTYKTQLVGEGASKYKTEVVCRRVKKSSDPQPSILESKIEACSKIITHFGAENLLPKDFQDPVQLLPQSTSASASATIDEVLFSRQLSVFGLDAMRKMATCDVLISGLGGLGVEIAKNVILGGVKSVTLRDVSPCQASDLASQFYLSEADIGKNRAEVSLRNLSELNNYVPVKASSEELTKEFLQSFRVVVLTDSSLEEQLRVAEIVRSFGNILIVAQTRGLFAQVFCDYGPDCTVVDLTGEEPSPIMIQSVTRSTEGIVTTECEIPHNLQSGDYVSFTNVNGMVELNGCEPRPIQVLGPSTFSIGDTTGLSADGSDGEVYQIKMPQKVQFKPLAQALDEPEFVITDWGKFDRPAQLHLAFRALDVWVKKEGRQPNPWSRTDSKSFFQVAQDVNNSIVGAAKVEEVDENLLSTFAHVCRGVLNPIDATIGGIAAQEVMKACSEKFTPIVQWLYFDATECLPDNCDLLTEEQCKPTGSRYDGQIAIFGSDFQKKLGSLQYFVVGAGAIGCEILKNFAMLGVGAGKGGHIYVTDMDLIEKSNLNRQFLFRPWDVQKAKSSTAAAAVQVMNPNVNITPFEDRVGPETENFFDDEFFGKLHGVVNALDNVDARIYMDRRCVYYHKSLLESGTLGTKGNVQVVIPHLTESYSSSQDPRDIDIPFETIIMFPCAIEHTLQWARDMFDGLFRQPFESAAQYLTDPKFMDRTLKQSGSQPLETLESVKRALVDERPANFQACLKWARLLWQELYHNQIVHLLKKFPPDNVTPSGQPFWSGPRRCPHPLYFDVNYEDHLDFIVAVANLKAQIYGIPQNTDRRAIVAMLRKVVVPSSDMHIAVSSVETGGDANGFGSHYQDRLARLHKEIPRANSLRGLRIQPLEFGKYDQNSFHVDFLVNASNLRAANFDIEPADRHKSKVTTGRIIPAIVTTTAVVSGLVCIELIKLIQGHSKLESFKNGFINLALPLFCFSEPIAALKLKLHEHECTLWNRFEVKGELTLRGFLQRFEDLFKIKIKTLSHGKWMLYSLVLTPEERMKRMDMLLPDVIKLASGKKILPQAKALVFEMCFDDLQGKRAEGIYVRYQLPTE